MINVKEKQLDHFAQILLYSITDLHSIACSISSFFNNKKGIKGHETALIGYRYGRIWNLGMYSVGKFLPLAEL